MLNMLVEEINMESSDGDNQQLVRLEDLETVNVPD